MNKTYIFVDAAMFYEKVYIIYQIITVDMTFFHFINCLSLAYAPFFIVYKYSGLSEYSSVWKCAQATIAYFVTQLGKMLVLATFFPASDSENFDVVPELLKNSADVFDLIGLHIVINYLVAGKGEVRFITAGLGWAFAHSVATRFVGFWVGARATAFHWKFMQMAFESNIDLIFYIALAALVWLMSRNDLPTIMKRVVLLLLTFCVFHVFIYQFWSAHMILQPLMLLVVKAILTGGVALTTLFAYSRLAFHYNVNSYRN